MTTRRRSPWDWNWDDQAISGHQVAKLASAIYERFDRAFDVRTPARSTT